MSENALSRPLPETAAGSIPAISLEAAIYALLFAAAVLLRLIALEGTPRPEEVSHLLASWRGTESVSPALLWAQSLSFTMLGGSIIAARLLTAVAGVLLAFSPTLFRAELGRTRALMFTLLLVASAPMLITARTSSPVVWTALFGVIALRLWLNHIETPSMARGMQAVVATAALLLLSDPSGVVLALMLAAGAALTLLWRAATAESDKDAVSSIGAVRDALAQVSWDKSVLIAALVVAAAASGFMTAPSGLSSIGGLIGGVLNLFTPDSENAFGVAVFYQLLIWIMAVAAIFKNRMDGWSAPDRFFIGWLLAGLVALIVLPGLGSQHTVLLALPLCGLVSGLAAYAFAPDRHQQMVSDRYSASGDELAMLLSPAAGRFVLLIVVFALLSIFNVHLGSTTREFLQVEGGNLAGAISRMQNNLSSADFRIGLLWSFISFMFLLVGFFLAGSIWGNRVAAQGYILGALAMVLVTQLSGGWYVTEVDASDAVEPWHHEAATVSYALLDQTLTDFSFREAQGFPLLPITVVRNPATGATENGLLGWLLRNYKDVRWVDTVAEAATAPIVIAPDLALGVDVSQPDLGGSYVGQPFTLTKSWSEDTMQGFDFMTWFLQRRVRVEPSARLAVVLWVRQDVFDSRPIEDLLKK